ncbi:MAG: hypothetical protein KDB80_09770 [Planctomycetes bacterium]|nr:hypothetical protein [Planctomycetota bacterium]
MALRWILASCLVASGAAQTIVPESLAGVEGGSASSIPFGLSGPVRYQMLFDADQLPFDGPRLLTELRIRPDWDNGAAIAAKQFLRVDVDISTTARRAENVSGTFDENHGLDRTRVAAFHQLVLPALPAGGPAPHAAVISIPFDTPFWYGMLPFRPGEQVAENLCIDLQIVSQPSGPYRIDSPFTCDSQVTHFGLVDNPCHPSHTGPDVFLEIDSSDDVRAGSNITWSVHNCAPLGPFWIIVAATANGNWLGTPLPAPLFDSAPGCYVNVPLGALILSGTADASGDGEKLITLPSNRQLVGQTFHAQAFMLDLAANAFGYVTSMGVRSTVCGPLGIARVFRLGAATGTTGTVTFGSAPVIELP